MKPRHRAVLKWSALLLGWIIMLGLLAPFLISQADTFSVVAGAIALFSYAWITFLAIDTAVERAMLTKVPPPPTQPSTKEQK